MDIKIRRDWWKMTERPAEVEAIPWLPPAATAYLDTLLRQDMTVLEQGSGGSTLWLAQRVARVVSTENDELWRQQIKAMAPVNVEIIPGIAYPKVGPVDLVYIDGRPNTARIPWIVAAIELAKPGGIVVLDNSDDPEYATWRGELDKKAENWVTIHPGYPAQGFDTTFYRMPGGTERDI